MNRDLTRLKDWATSMAATDPDIPARALWSQIAAEVDAYLSASSEDPAAQDGPSLFDSEAAQ
jgi:hypothetical protein